MKQKQKRLENLGEKLVSFEAGSTPPIHISVISMLLSKVVDATQERWLNLAIKAPRMFSEKVFFVYKSLEHELLLLFEGEVRFLFYFVEEIKLLETIVIV